MTLALPFAHWILLIWATEGLLAMLLHFLMWVRASLCTWQRIEKRLLDIGGTVTFFTTSAKLPLFYLRKKIETQWLKIVLKVSLLILYFFCFSCLEQITDSSPLVRLRLHAWWGKSEERTPQKFVICLQMVLTGSISCRYAFPLPCEFIQ